MVILVIYLCTMLIRPQDWVPGLIGFPTATILIPLGFCIGLATHNQDKNSISVPQAKLLIGYLFIMFFTTFANTDMGNAVDIFVKYLKRVLVFFMFYWLITNEKQLRLILRTILLFVVFVVYQAYLEGTTGEGWAGLITYSDSVSPNRARWWGDWDGPNVLAIMFLICVPFALEMVWAKNVTTTRRLMGVLVFCLMLIGIFYTNSRGAMLTTVAVLGFNYRRKLLNPKYAVIAVCIGVVLLALAPSRVSEINSKEASAGERIWLWEEGLKYFRQHEIIGLGKEQFQKKATLHLRAHSNYVQNLAELGIFGFFTYLSLLWLSFRGGHRVATTKIPISDSMRSLNNGMLNSVVAFSVVTFFVTFELDFMYMLFGVCAAANSIACKQYPGIAKPDFTKIDFFIVGTMMAVVYFALWLAAVVRII